MRHIFVFLFIAVIFLTGCGESSAKPENSIKEASGIFDESFNKTGYAIFNHTANGSDRGVELEAQSDGKLIIKGYASNGDELDVLLMRYNTDGSLDNSFGNNGIALHVGKGNLDDKGLGLAVDLASNDIYVTGFSYLAKGNRDLLLLKFDGRGNEIGVTHFSSLPDSTDIGFAAAVQPDGKILVAGESRKTSENQKLVLLRYNPDLTLDKAFGNAGVVYYNPLSTTKAFGVAMQGNDKIIVVGTTQINGKYHVLAMRYNLDGSLDTSFAAGGKFTWNHTPNDMDVLGNEMAIQSDGKILIGGNSADSKTSSVYILRLNPDGTPDNTFGTDGAVHYVPQSGWAESFSIAVADDNKPVICGTEKVGDVNNALILRYNSNGQPDTGFAENGVFKFNAPNAKFSVANGIFIQKDKKIAVTGYSHTDTHDDVLTIRLK